MGLFTDDNKGSDKDRVELARRAIAENGGMAMGSAAQDAKEKKDADAKLRDQSAFNAQMTALQIMMQDPAYRAVYERVSAKLEDVQTKLDQEIIDNAEEIEHLEAGAATSKDGEPVFQKEDGSFVYADGSSVPAENVPVTSDMPKGATSWEDYLAAKKRAAELARIQGEVLDPARTRIQDPDNPPSKTELEEIETELEKADATIDNAKSVDPDITVEAKLDTLSLNSFPAPGQ